MLLHEGLGSVAAWRGFPARLAERTDRAVIAYSRLGYGRSDAAPLPRPVTFMHDEARARLPAVLDALAPGPVTLYGHSDGGSIALLAAASHPERVEALILEAPHVFVEALSVASIERMRVQFETGDLRTRLARLHDSVDIAFRGWNDVWLSPEFRGWNIEDQLPLVTCPVLVIQGDDDEYGTPAQVEAIARQVRGRVTVRMLPACGHAPHRERPEAVLDAVAEFIP